MQDSIFEFYNPKYFVAFGITDNITPYQWLVSYVASYSITFDMLYNADDVINAYGAYFVPTYVLIDTEGRIRFRGSEYYFDRISELKEIINGLIQ